MAHKSYTYDNTLEEESIVFSSYLIGKKPSDEIIQRYIDANRKLGLDYKTGNEALLLFARVHPGAVSFLDAAAGIIDPEEVIRKKIYTMAAILETSPEYTSYFMPEHLSTFKLLGRLTLSSMSSIIKILIGIPMFILIRKYYA